MLDQPNTWGSLCSLKSSFSKVTFDVKMRLTRRAHKQSKFSQREGYMASRMHGRPKKNGETKAERRENKKDGKPKRGKKQGRKHK